MTVLKHRALDNDLYFIRSSTPVGLLQTPQGVTSPPTLPIKEILVDRKTAAW